MPPCMTSDPSYHQTPGSVDNNSLEKLDNSQAMLDVLGGNSDHDLSKSKSSFGNLSGFGGGGGGSSVDLMKHAAEGGDGNGKDDNDDDSLATTTVNGASPSAAGNKDGGLLSDAHNHKSSSITRWQRGIQLAWILCLLGLPAATVVYFDRVQAQAAQTEFHLSATRWVDATHDLSRTLAQSMQAHADSLTSQAILANQSWPYVVAPLFESDAYHTRQIAHLQTLAYAPVVVEEQEKMRWDAFASYAGPYWQSQSLQLQQWQHQQEGHRLLLNSNNDTKEQHGPFAPLWQTSPTLSLDTHPDLLKHDTVRTMVEYLQLDDNGATTSPLVLLSDASNEWNFLSNANQNNDSQVSGMTQRHTLVLTPIHQNHDPERRQMAAVLVGVLSWDTYVQNIIGRSSRDGVPTIVAVTNTCGQTLTYQYHQDNDGPVYVGANVPAPPDAMSVSTPFEADQSSTRTSTTKAGDKVCEYSLLFYSTTATTTTVASPWILAAIAFVGIAILGLLVVHYLSLLARRQSKISKLAHSATAVIAGLFPETVRDRILSDAMHGGASKSSNKDKRKGKQGSSRMRELRRQVTTKDKDAFKSVGQGGDDESTIVSHTAVHKTKPIADLFPEATVLFSDIVGFTAWSSTREPCQVFQLLEAIYHAFDQIAHRRKVFKVETIGDCYVAVTGLPVPRKDHAIVMCRFARDCLNAMDAVTKKLEVSLGPDTSDLNMRFGLHSGPVTAGVLRGERSRFQLFGDTVNTAARMESNGKAGRVHISQATADCLAAFGKNFWFIHREDKIQAKGKGVMQTYWLDVAHLGDDKSKLEGAASPASTDNSATPMDGSNTVSTRPNDAPNTCRTLISPRERRLIDWNVEVLLKLLRQIEARRLSTNGGAKLRGLKCVIPQAAPSQQEVRVFDEVKEIISMPEVDPKVFKNEIDPQSVKLHPDVVWQLTDFVTSISTMYRKNAFHNFEHASHVTMSVTKLLSRVVSPSPVDERRSEMMSQDQMQHASVGNSYGINSDPLTQFAVVFAALIHDVDHLGVSNAQLVKENHRLSRIYNGTSVAEQNSVNIAWDILLDPANMAVRNSIYTTEDEFVRFRSLVVNAVMATDIVDKNLKALRNERWAKAFEKNAAAKVTKSDIDRKATIVIEHLIQASDVAHTMQHWHVYRKWNERLFREMWKAYQDGRMERNPAEFWYEGEIGFFDFYIIPLAKKLRDCGVFGVSCDEYLNYALHNREEWIEKGQEVVKQLRASVCNEDDNPKSMDNSQQQ